jgi:hypothetical protein
VTGCAGVKGHSSRWASVSRGAWPDRRRPAGRGAKR